MVSYVSQKGALISSCVLGVVLASAEDVFGTAPFGSLQKHNAHFMFRNRYGGCLYCEKMPSNRSVGLLKGNKIDDGPFNGNNFLY